MKLTLLQRAVDPLTLARTFTFSLPDIPEERVTEIFSRLRGQEVEVKLEPQRSMNSNAYFHILCRKIAQSMTPPLTETRVKNQMLLRYGVALWTNGKMSAAKMNVKADDLWEQEAFGDYHFIPFREADENGTTICWCKIILASHKYDSKEMSVLIDGTVQEAKELGIETLTPSELERMNAQWKVS
ncbi:MAG: hypothetical protein HUJ98_13095 [Bacteroidaceae bacterium]|nr:hypothetical protein [Bacteroidaceae bacterium]